jgi:hypothetical protein
VATKCGGSAQFDGAHNPPLNADEVAVMRPPISGAMAAKNVRNLQIF